MTTLFIIWLIVGAAGLAMWSLVLGAHGNNDDRCERCGNSESWWWEDEDILICDKCYDYDVNHADYWDGHP